MNKRKVVLASSNGKAQPRARELGGLLASLREVIQTARQQALRQLEGRDISGKLVTLGRLSLRIRSG